MITIQKIPQTKVIEVSPIDENTPEELLKYYFEGQRFGEGEVVDIQMKYDQGCAVVTFADTKGMIIKGFSFEFCILLELGGFFVLFFGFAILY